VCRIDDKPSIALQWTLVFSELSTTGTVGIIVPDINHIVPLSSTSGDWFPPSSLLSGTSGSLTAPSLLVVANDEQVFSLISLYFRLISFVDTFMYALYSCLHPYQARHDFPNHLGTVSE